MTYLGIRPLTWIAAVATILLTVALGNWQMRRGAQKEALAARVAQAAVAPVMPANSRLDQLVPWSHVGIEGRWDPSGVVYLDNRTDSDRAGLYVVMPLVASDGERILVVRGWLPRDPADRRHIAPYETPQGIVTVDGVVMLEEPRLLELGHATAASMGGLWQNLDYGDYARASGHAVVPRIVREDPGPVDGLSRHWPDRGSEFAGQIARHYGYAAQWYGLALLVAVLLVIFGIRNARRSNPPA